MSVLKPPVFLMGDASSDEQWCPAEAEVYSFDWHYSVITASSVIFYSVINKGSRYKSVWLHN